MHRRGTRLGRCCGLVCRDALSRIGEAPHHPQLAASGGLPARDASLRTAEVACEIQAPVSSALAGRIRTTRLPLRRPSTLPVRLSCFTPEEIERYVEAWSRPGALT